MSESEHGKRPTSQAWAPWNRPAVGAFVAGLILGGIPLGIIFHSLRGRAHSPELLRFILICTPIATLAVAVSATLYSSSGWRSLLQRVVTASVGACLPLPTAACLELDWSELGYEIFTPNNFSFFVVAFTVWAVVVAMLAGLIICLLRLIRGDLKQPNQTGP
jgi:hypothetical protein